MRCLRLYGSLLGTYPTSGVSARFLPSISSFLPPQTSVCCACRIQYYVMTLNCLFSLQINNAPGSISVSHICCIIGDGDLVSYVCMLHDSQYIVRYLDLIRFYVHSDDLRNLNKCSSAIAVERPNLILIIPLTVRHDPQCSRKNRFRENVSGAASTAPPTFLLMLPVSVAQG